MRLRISPHVSPAPFSGKSGVDLIRPAALFLFAAVLACPQAATQANSAYQTPEGRASLAAGLDRPEREAELHPAELVAALGLKHGDTVVDLGTGPGFMLPYLSRAVAQSGKVVAEDIHADFLDRAREKAAKLHLDNVQFVLGTDSDPKLPAKSADLILVLDVYHHFDYPAKMLAAFAVALRPGGRLAIVEYYRRRGAIGAGDFALTHIRLDAGGLVKEVESNGYRLVDRHDHVPGSQYIAIFRVR